MKKKRMKRNNPLIQLSRTIKLIKRTTKRWIKYFKTKLNPSRRQSHKIQKMIRKIKNKMRRSQLKPRKKNLQNRMMMKRTTKRMMRRK